MSEFVSICPKCHQKILCDTQYANQRVNCPLCMQDIIMPNPPSSQGHTPSAPAHSHPSAGGKPGIPVSYVVIGAVVLILAIGVLILMGPGKHFMAAAPTPPTTPAAPLLPPVSEGTNELVLRESGRALGTTAFGTQNGSLCEQWDYAGSSNQKWDIISLGHSQYKIISIASDRALTVLSDTSADGASVGILDYTGKSIQKWILTAVTNGYYRLSPVSAPSLCLDVRGNQNGSMATLQFYSNQTYQQWSFQPQ